MPARQLLWIRHAAVDPDPSAPARAWPLTPEGREDAARLARSLPALPPPLSVVTSDERKAIETAEELWRALDLPPPVVSPDLREVERPWTGGDYRSVAREYLRSGSVPGWEPREDVLERLSRALAEHWRPEGTTIVICHGLAMSLWVADAVDGLDAVVFWDGLVFPDAWLYGEEGAFRRIDW